MLSASVAQKDDFLTTLRHEKTLAITSSQHSIETLERENAIKSAALQRLQDDLESEKSTKKDLEKELADSYGKCRDVAAEMEQLQQTHDELVSHTGKLTENAKEHQNEV